MKILTVSDRVEPMLYDHFDLKNFPGVEMILSCGDLPPEYLSFLVSAFNVPLYYVRGNHDIRYGTSPPEGCVDLNGRLAEISGLTILGLEGSRWYNGGPVQYTESQMKRRINGMRLKIWWQKGIDIVITHAPPRYIHDAEDPCHRGFKSFRTLIDRHQPAYFIHGHIHTLFTKPEQRVTMSDQTRIINTFGYHLIEVDHGKTDR